MCARGAAFHRLTMSPGNIGTTGFHILTQKSKNNSNRKEAKLSNDCEWQKRFDSVLRKIQRRSLLYRPEKIESDITRAVREVRKENRYA